MDHPWDFPTNTMSSRLIGKTKQRSSFRCPIPAVGFRYPVGWPRRLNTRVCWPDVDCDLLLDVGANRGQFSLISSGSSEAPASRPSNRNRAKLPCIAASSKGIPWCDFTRSPWGQGREADLHISRRRTALHLPIGNFRQNYSRALGSRCAGSGRLPGQPGVKLDGRSKNPAQAGCPGMN